MQDDFSIWIIVVIISVAIIIITFLTSVNILHKKFIEKPFSEINKNKESKDTE